MFCRPITAPAVSPLEDDVIQLKAVWSARWNLVSIGERQHDTSLISPTHGEHFGFLNTTHTHNTRHVINLVIPRHVAPMGLKIRRHIQPIAFTCPSLLHTVVSSFLTAHQHTFIIIIIIINEKIIVAFSPRTTRTRYKVKKQNREIRRV